MRIAYFSECMTPGQDGVSRVLQRLVVYHRTRGHNVCWITALPDPSLPEAQLCTRSVPVPGYAPYRMSTGWPGHLLAQLTAFAPDVLHIHAPFWLGWAASRLAQRLGIPCVATFHTDFASYVGYHGSGVLAPLLRWHNRLVYNACTLTLVPSRTMQAALTAEGIRRTQVLPHGVDAGAFGPTFRSAAWRQAISAGSFGPATCILLYVGRLVWEKNLALLAQVLPEVLASQPTVAFVFVGDGPARGALQQLLPQAHFLGYQAGEALATAYASSDALVFPSATETFGNVTLEAMASGLACLVADAGGSADLVEHGVTGLKFAPHCAADLARNLHELVQNEPLRECMARHGLAFAQRQTWPAILDQQQQVYEELVAHRAGQTPRPTPSPPPAPVEQITRELVGWSLPQTGVLETGKLVP